MLSGMGGGQNKKRKAIGRPYIKGSAEPSGGTATEALPRRPCLEHERADRLRERRVGREGLERLVREVGVVVGGHAVEAGGGDEDGALLAGAIVEPEGRGDRLARGMRGVG